MKKLAGLLGKQSNNTTNTLLQKTVQVDKFVVKCEEAIGEGGYASIYKARDVSTGALYALKHIRLNADTDALKEVMQEGQIMARLRQHPNILKMHAMAFAGSQGAETDAFMLLDYCPTTLLDMMQRSHFNLDEFFVYEVFSEVCQAVAHMHRFSPPYAHRDIKAENVLKNSSGRWVICDFGSTTDRAQVYESPAEIAMEEEVIRRTTTPAYRAPEMWDLMSRQRIDTKVDIWALGVLLYVLVAGKLPFQGGSKLEVLFGKYELPAGKSPVLCALIKELLIPNPDERPDIVQVLSRLEVVKQQLAAGIAGAMGAGDGMVPTPAPVVPTQPPPPPAATLPTVLPAQGSLQPPVVAVQHSPAPPPAAPQAPLPPIPAAGAALSAPHPPPLSPVTSLQRRSNPLQPKPSAGSLTLGSSGLSPVLAAALQPGGGSANISAGGAATHVSVSASPAPGTTAQLPTSTKPPAGPPPAPAPVLSSSLPSVLSAGLSPALAAGLQTPPPPPPPPAPTATLIDVASPEAPPVPAAVTLVEQKASLLGAVPSSGPVPQPSHRHKKSSSMAKVALEAFEPDWGEEQPDWTAGRGSGVAAGGPGSNAGGGVKPSMPAHSRNHSAVAADLYEPGSQGGGMSAAQNASLVLEVESLRVQVKGLSASHHALSARVKHLEEIVAHQARTISQLTQQGSSGPGGWQPFNSPS